ncbi:Acyl-CoA N-acyltransferase [Apiospora rasikravindrae]|uniref:Acyl-CoA N-acyltransferase n=1 Tax=Apiospora rasikravindrae TaxID=990691 RepID=A0ABR1SQR1_9PEZI
MREAPNDCRPQGSLEPGRRNQDHLTVHFAREASVISIQSAQGTSSTDDLRMANQLYETFSGEEVTDTMLSDAAKLFSNNYGVWGPESPKRGQHVKLSTSRLRAQYLPEGAATAYTRVSVNGTLAGNAFVCRWKHDGRIICWITQLVVHKEYRERGLAGGLLRSLRGDTDEIYGIMSSHPAACLAAAKCFGSTPFALAEALLAASSIRTRSAKSPEHLEKAQELVRKEDCMKLKARIAYRRSIVLRLAGDTKASQRMIEEFMASATSNTDEVLNENIAALQLSQASNHVYNFEFPEAHAEAKKWTPDLRRLDWQESLLWDQIFCVGRITRGEGRFQEARTCFEACMRNTEISEAKRHLVKSAVTDIYCELAYSEGALSYLAQAEAILEPELARLRQLSRHQTKGFRRLLLSLTEVRIRQDRRDEAKLLAIELLAIYQSIKYPDIIDRLGHVRTHIALARISSSLEEEAMHWTSVLDWNRYYNPLEEEVFTCGVVYLFLCVVWHRLGEAQISLQFLQNANQVLCRRNRQYLIPGLGTYLFRDVSQVAQPAAEAFQLPALE